MVCAAGKIEEKEFGMGDRSLDTGEFNEYGEWESYRAKGKSWSGPSPFPLLVLAILIGLIVLLGRGPDSRPQGGGPMSLLADESRR